MIIGKSMSGYAEFELIHAARLNTLHTLKGSCVPSKISLGLDSSIFEEYCRMDVEMPQWFNREPYVHHPYENLTELVKIMIDVGCDPRYNLTINY